MYVCMHVKFSWKNTSRICKSIICVQSCTYVCLHACAHTCMHACIQGHMSTHIGLRFWWRASSLHSRLRPPISSFAPPCPWYWYTVLYYSVWYWCTAHCDMQCDSDPSLRWSGNSAFFNVQSVLYYGFLVLRVTDVCKLVVWFLAYMTKLGCGVRSTKKKLQYVIAT